jgi:Protein of unknown function (DUF3822)
VTIAEISMNTLEPTEDVSAYNLLVVVSTGFFAYAVTDTQGVLKLFEKYTRAENDAGFLSQLNTQNDWLLKTYRQVKVAYFSQETIAMPSLYYHPGSAPEHLDYVYGDTGETIMLNDFIGHRSLYCLYRVEKDLVRAVVRRFPLAAVWHVQSLLLSQKDTAREGAILHINFMQDACSFMLQKEGQLLTVKSYPFHHVADVAFTLLALCQMHGVPPETAQLTVGGWITEKSPMYEELRKYFQHTSFAFYPAAPKGFEQFPPHFFEIFHLLQSV